MVVKRLQRARSLNSDCARPVQVAVNQKNLPVAKSLLSRNNCMCLITDDGRAGMLLSDDSEASCR